MEERRGAGFIPGVTAFLFLLVPMTRSFGTELFGSWAALLLLLAVCIAAMAAHILYRRAAIPIPFHPLDIAWALSCVVLLIRNQMIAEGYYADVALSLLSMAYALTLRCETGGFRVMRRTMVAFALLYACVTWLSFWAPAFYLARIVPLFPQSNQLSVSIAFTQFREYMGLTDHYSRNAYYLTLGMIVLLTDFIAGRPQYRIPKAAMIAFLAATLLLVGKRGHTVFLAFSFLLTYVVRRHPSPGTLLRAAGIALAGALLLALMTVFIPGASRLVERLFPADGTDITTGRSELYARAWAMFKESPLFGNGWGAFSLHSGYDAPGVHNDYLQLLAEVGVVGTFVVLLANFGTYALTWRLMRGDARPLIVLSFFFQTFFLSYALTGIPHYDFEVNMVYLLLCAPAYAARLEERSA